MNLSFYPDTYLPSDRFAAGGNLPTLTVADYLNQFEKAGTGRDREAVPEWGGERHLYDRRGVYVRLVRCPGCLGVHQPRSRERSYRRRRAERGVRRVYGISWIRTVNAPE